MYRIINNRLYVQAKDLDYISYMGLDKINKFPNDLENMIKGITDRIDDYTFVPFKDEEDKNALNKVLDSFAIDYDKYQDYSLGEIENEISCIKKEIEKYADDEEKYDEWLIRRNLKHMIGDFEFLYNFKEHGFGVVPFEPRKAPDKIIRLF